MLPYVEDSSSIDWVKSTCTGEGGRAEKGRPPKLRPTRSLSHPTDPFTGRPNDRQTLLHRTLSSFQFDRRLRIHKQQTVIVVLTTPSRTCKSKRDKHVFQGCPSPHSKTPRPHSSSLLKQWLSRKTPINLGLPSKSESLITLSLLRSIYRPWTLMSNRNAIKYVFNKLTPVFGLIYPVHVFRTFLIFRSIDRLIFNLNYCAGTPKRIIRRPFWNVRRVQTAWLSMM